ncbi:MAG: LysR family transcriptional regulator [Alphaproteobacteria bacterium]|nr:LysR family transcriptional regulator [Alphaproteobacteria bacterium]
MDWDKLRVFHAVAEAGSFTHAGELLNLSQSAVSRQISALEESLETTLFHRHARGLILTEQGELLYQTTHEVYHKLAMAEAQLSESKERPSGPLKITTTIGLGSLWLTSRIKEFIELYPEVDVTLILTDTELDLSMREADIAVRLQSPRQPDLIQRPLLTVHTHVYAAAEYLEEHGTPERPEDLDHHRLLVYGQEWPAPVPEVNWILNLGARPDSRRRPILRVNNIYGIYRACRSGLGLAGLPDYAIPTGTNLVRVLPDINGPSFRAYFVYPEELRHSKRIGVFRDFLLRKVAEHNF